METSTVIILDSSDEDDKLASKKLKKDASYKMILHRTSKPTKRKSTKLDVSDLPRKQVVHHILTDEDKSSGDCFQGKSRVTTVREPPTAKANTNQKIGASPSLTSQKKRIQPIKISECLLNAKHSVNPSTASTTSEPPNEESNADANADVDAEMDDNENDLLVNGFEMCLDEDPTDTKPTKIEASEVFESFLSACRVADPSSDMEAAINKKFMRYYSAAHPRFVTSKSFCKMVSAVTDEIVANPKYVYTTVQKVLEELKVRRVAAPIDEYGTEEAPADKPIDEADKKKERNIRRLNHALHTLKRRIAQLEATEVDLDDDNNSAYLLLERSKERAFRIYEQLCDLTGEDKNAIRQSRRPIKFDCTSYPQFNKIIQKYVFRRNTFPDYLDVLKYLGHCNTQYGYNLRDIEMKTIAHDSFIKIGRLLQNRRKEDLYENLNYFVNEYEKDPATADTNLQSKLLDNKKTCTKINEIIDQFAVAQDRASKEQKVDNNKENLQSAVATPDVVTHQTELHVKIEDPIEIHHLLLTTPTDDDIVLLS